MLNGTAGKLYGGAAYRHFSSAAFTRINDDASVEPLSYIHYLTFSGIIGI